MTVHAKARKHVEIDTLRETSYKLAKMLDNKEVSARDAAGLALQLRQILERISEIEASIPDEASEALSAVEQMRANV